MVRIICLEERQVVGSCRRDSLRIFCTREPIACDIRPFRKMNISVTAGNNPERPPVAGVPRPGRKEPSLVERFCHHVRPCAELALFGLTSIQARGQANSGEKTAGLKIRETFQSHKKHHTGTATSTGR